MTNDALGLLEKIGLIWSKNKKKKQKTNWTTGTGGNFHGIERRPKQEISEHWLHGKLKGHGIFFYDKNLER